MPVPCQVPCGLCGDIECICRTEKPCDLTYAEANKIVNEYVRSDFDFKSAVLNALKGGEKK